MIVVKYCDVITDEGLFVFINPSYIPNINEKIIFSNNNKKYKGFVEDKIITLDGVNNLTVVKLCISINKE